MFVWLAILAVSCWCCRWTAPIYTDKTLTYFTACSQLSGNHKTFHGQAQVFHHATCNNLCKWYVLNNSHHMSRFCNFLIIKDNFKFKLTIFIIIVLPSHPHGFTKNRACRFVWQNIQILQIFVPKKGGYRYQKIVNDPSFKFLPVSWQILD